VMLLTAQPLHAFDLDKVPGGALIIRAASEGETMTTLDGVERSFDTDAVLVCDRNGPSGIAGIMGGQVSEVSDSTTRVLLEVATWNGVNILRTSRKLGLRSDASNRFEKQLHPELAMRAQRIASRLIVELCGARMVPGTIDEAAEIPPPHSVRLRTEHAERLLGMRVEAEQCETYLERLGFSVDRDGEELTAEVPFDRHYDVSREVDLIEEVGRIHGYDEHLPSTLPEAVGQGGRLSREQTLRRRAEDVMRDLGFDAILTLSLTDPGMPARLRLPQGDQRREPIRVSNPLSLDHSELRTSLLGSVLDAARYNLAHGAERVALFESGRAYLKDRPASDPVARGSEAEQATGIGVLAGVFAGQRPAPAHEPHRVCCLAVGSLAQQSWRSDAAPADFFALKGVLEALATQLGAALEVEQGSEPFLHPGRSARVLVGGAEAGWLGEIHPLVCRQWDLDAAAGFEVDLGELAGAASLGREHYEDVTGLPAVHEDLSVIVASVTPAGKVRDAVLSGGGELLRSAEVFDLYRGEQVGEGRKSLALRLTFRAPDRTLTDGEVAGLR
jgi:phenylalanyl-tRNA synthetase beta chain